MPYIITTTRELEWEGETLATVSRRAVATLEEARTWAYRLLDNNRKQGALNARPMNSDEQRADRWRRLAIRDLPESGGTVGPLPDGTVIEVARVEIAALAAMVPRLLDDGENVIDAYNAKEGSP